MKRNMPSRYFGVDGVIITVLCYMVILGSRFQWYNLWCNNLEIQKCQIIVHIPPTGIYGLPLVILKTIVKKKNVGKTKHNCI